MPLAAFAMLLVLLWAAPATALGAEPARPFFVDLGVETVGGRQNAVAVPLADGRVLIAGGADDVAVRSAEVFDPVAIEFVPVPNLTRYKRTNAVGARLPDGRVLIAGGSNDVSYAHAEVFDPEDETFTDVADEMTTPRNGAIAAPLPDGRILIAGGRAEGENLRSAEVFDPANETFTGLAAQMRREHDSAVGGVLPDGRVLIAAGGTGSAAVTEIFDPQTGAFELLETESGNGLGSAVGAVLPSGQMLVTGGISGGMSRRWAGIVDATSGAFGYLPKEGGTQTVTERWGAMAAALPGGLTLISGGSWSNARSTAEIFVSAPALSATGNQFGNRVLGADPATATVVVENLGWIDLEIDGVALSGVDAADFSVLSDSCTGAELDFEETCALGVRFAPTRLGTATASLSFDSNEPQPSSVPLTATGIAPAIAQPPIAGPPLGPPAPRRRVHSVGCQAKPVPRSRRLKVSCRAEPSSGIWELRLRRAGAVVADRRVRGGARTFVFHPPRGRGGFRLELIPL